MEEKKLTDEEIVKLLEQQKEFILNETERTNNPADVILVSYDGQDILALCDLIQRLQSDIEYKTDCYNDLCNMNNEIYMEMCEQKAEIERLKKFEMYRTGSIFSIVPLISPTSFSHSIPSISYASPDKTSLEKRILKPPNTTETISTADATAKIILLLSVLRFMVPLHSYYYTQIFYHFIQ